MPNSPDAKVVSRYSPRPGTSSPVYPCFSISHLWSPYTLNEENIGTVIASCDGSSRNGDAGRAQGSSMTSSLLMATAGTLSVRLQRTLRPYTTFRSQYALSSTKECPIGPFVERRQLDRANYALLVGGRPTSLLSE